MLSDVEVKLDNRVRLMSAAIAATDWPDKDQARKPHGTHAHSRATRKFLNDHSGHEAIKTLQILLDRDAPLEALFTLALHWDWPELTTDSLPRWVHPEWNHQLRDFFIQSKLEDWWHEEEDVWERAFNDSQKMFAEVNFSEFLRPFVGEIEGRFVFMPNISYPTIREVPVRMEHELVCIAPPPLAWGDSPPWPFDEDAAYIRRTAMSVYGRLLLLGYLRRHPEQMREASANSLPVSDQFVELHPTWEDQFITLFVAGATAIYLEEHLSIAEAKAYVLMERKARGMTILPGVVSVLRRYLKQLEDGKYNTLLDFLPLFPKQLRIAKRITTL